MEFILMNGDIETLHMDLEEGYLEVIDNQFLPYPMKDHIKTTGEKDTAGSLADISVVRDWLSGRMMQPDRVNYRCILESAGLSGDVTETEDRLKVVYACHGLSMIDSYWLKKPDENLKFAEVNLRHRKISDRTYGVSILGEKEFLGLDELAADIMTRGSFAKCWMSDAGLPELWKADRTRGTNVRAEVSASKWCVGNRFHVVSYRAEEREGYLCSVCRCIADDSISLVPAIDVMDYCRHNGNGYCIPFEELREHFPEYYDMTVIDYILANTDRHIENWGFMVENSTNEIGPLAPLFDFNQSLIADSFHSDINDLIYDPTGRPFSKSPYYVLDGFDWSTVSADGLTPEGEKRLEKVVEIYRQM